MPEKFKGVLSREEEYVKVTSSEPYEGLRSAETMEDFEKQVELFKEKHGIEPKFLVELRKGRSNEIKNKLELNIERADKGLHFAETIGLFERYVTALTEKYGAELPKNIGELRKKCLERNKEILEADIVATKTDDYKTMRQTELTEINRRLEELEK